MKIGITSIERLQFRVMIPFVGLMALLLAVMTWVTTRQFSRMLTEQLVVRGRMAAQSLANEVAIPMLLEDRDGLMFKLDRVRQVNPDLSSVSILRPDGSPWISIGRTTNDPRSVMLSSSTKDMLVDQIKKTVVYSGIYDRRSRLMGFVEMELSKVSILGEIQEAATSLMVVNVVAFTVIGFFLSLLLRRIKRLSDHEKQRSADVENAYNELQRVQDQLVRSEKMAAIGQLASSVGHEIRNPLGAIKNAIFYIRDSLKGTSVIKNDPTINEFLAMADREIDNATRITTDLMEFARVIRLELEDKDINAVVHSVSEDVDCPENIHYVEKLEMPIPPFRFDPYRLRQVLSNLTQNAVQAMPRGGILSVSTRTGPAPQSVKSAAKWVYIDYNDTGEGIDSAMLDRIFEPLFTTKAKGTGLGLAICSSIVKAHGGVLTVRSKKNEGTTFTIAMPMEGHHG